MNYTNGRLLSQTLIVLIFLLLTGCEEKKEVVNEYKFLSNDGFFILNEGNYLAGNGTISFFSYDSLKVFNDLYLNSNGRPLGDIVFSAIASEENLSIVVNNSGKIVMVDMADMKSTGTITNLISPRYIRNINTAKAYVSSLFSDSIIIVDPAAKTIEGYINLGASSEYILVSGSFAYVSNWSGGSSIAILSTESDSVLETIELKSEPGNIVVDYQGYIWVLCNGGWKNEEYPVLYRLMPESGEIISEFTFSNLTDSPTELCIDKSGTLLYFLNGDIFRMSIDDQQIPVIPFIEAGERNYYGMDVDPDRGNILVSDAIDYMQNGSVYIYSESGEELISFRAGIIPGSFCFKN